MQVLQQTVQFYRLSPRICNCLQIKWNVEVKSRRQRNTRIHTFPIDLPILVAVRRELYGKQMYAFLVNKYLILVSAPLKRNFLAQINTERNSFMKYERYKQILWRYLCLYLGFPCYFYVRDGAYLLRINW